MKTTLLVTVGALLGLVSNIALAADESTRDEYERRARAINRAAEKESVFKQGLHHVAIETGVPESTIEAQHRHNPDLGLAGILLANSLAAETKKESATFIKQRKAGKGWAAMAKENNVPLDNLNRKLENLEKAIGLSAEKNGANAPSEEGKPEGQQPRQR